MISLSFSKGIFYMITLPIKEDYNIGQLSGLEAGLSMGRIGEKIRLSDLRIWTGLKMRDWKSWGSEMCGVIADRYLLVVWMN